MSKLRNFLFTLRHSLIPLDHFYVKIRKETPFSSSAKYLFVLTFLLSLTLTFIYPAKYVPLYQPEKFSEYVSEILDQFPEEASVVVNENGILTSNHNRPIIIFTPDTTPEKLLVVDPQATNDMIDTYDASILLMRKKAVIKTFEGSIEFDYRGYQSSTINQQTIQNLRALSENIFNNYSMFLIMLLILGVIVIPILFTISKFIYIALASFIVFIPAKITIIKDITFPKAYQIGLHASTGPILLEYTSFLFDLYIPVKMWFFTITLVFIAGACYEAYLEKRHAGHR